ncbi:DUF5829 family protein [Actinokineospora xionganensis]|uniref:Glyoxalase-like protein n=1 Tax=Actinokineospora xionganensis TaxID=2684470 RepID=A0ABR7L5E7_9PSEU|nr:DUF5829 family protein [Actinokineospora xionganensis]MBC6447901.1 hypothetical protein [Actinokineospora xionganensis]
MTTESTSVQAPPAPRMDHVMVLVDQTTYQDVVDAEFLGTRFARRKHKQADSSIAGSYSTLGLAGDNTLIELFGSSMPGSSPLTGGLVFSFERPGSAQSARAALDGSAEYHYDLVRRADKPWYHLISVGLGQGSPLLLFLNEVTPEYFTSLGAQPEADGALRRRDYLDAVLGEPADGKMLRDIVGVTLAVTAARARAIATALTQFDFAERADAEGIVLVGPGLTVRLHTADVPTERVIEIQLALTGIGVEPGSEFTFGASSRLVIDSMESARWFFGEPN